MYTVLYTTKGQYATMSEQHILVKCHPLFASLISPNTNVNLR